MADGALHAAGGGTVFLGNFRVEALGHSVDVLRLVHGEQDGIPQKLIALDVGGNADLVQDLSNCQLITVHAGVQDALFLPGSHLQHAVCQNRLVKGLDEVVSKALVQQLLHHFLALERPRHKERGVTLTGCIVLLFHSQRIQPGHKGIQQHHLGPHCKHFLQDLQAVFFHHGHLYSLLLQSFTTGCRDLCASIRHQKFDLVHRSFLQCVRFSLRF